MDEKDYGLRDMAKYFAPADKELTQSYNISDQTYWLSLGSCTAPTSNRLAIKNNGQRVEMVLSGKYAYKAISAPELYFQIGKYKSNAIVLNNKGGIFTLRCTIPKSAVIDEKSIDLKADNMRDGSILVTNMTLNVYRLNETSQTPPDTIGGCLTVIANWIRKQN